jgi:LysR family transcriptional regulator, nod-box dependent transcriptional activator
MRFKGLDLNLLVAFDAILVEGTITRAAQRVHLSQSAMSNALARLREHYRDELFVQVGRKLVRTPLAEALAGPVRDILLRVDTTVALTPGFDPASSGRCFVLAASDYIMAVLLDRLLARVYREAPDISFELLPVDRGMELLERGDVDLLLFPKQFERAEHPGEPTIEDTYTCVVWEGNTQVGETLTLERYLEAGHVATRLGVDRMPTFEGWFLKRFGIQRRIEVATYNLTSPPRLVIGTQRIATVHTRLARQMARSLPLRLVAPPVEIPRLISVMQWHRYKAHDPGLAWLRRMVHEVAAEDDDDAPRATAQPAA